MYYSLIICEWNSYRALTMSRSVSHGPVWLVVYRGVSRCLMAYGGFVLFLTEETKRIWTEMQWIWTAIEGS